MTRYLAAWLLVGLLATNVRAEPAAPFTMWVAEGRTNQVYLLGSVHLLRPEDYPLPVVVDRAYADAEFLVMELDMDDIDPLATQGLVNRLGLLPPGETLEDTLGAAAWAQASEKAALLDVPLDLLARSEPWLAAVTIEQLVLTRLGFNPLYGVEMNLVSRAAADNKTITGLETIEQQLGFLDELSAAAQRDLLLQTLAEAESISTLMDELITAWREGDLAYLEANMLDALADYPELYRTILADRNARWLNKLMPLFDKPDDYLVIVGALHLIGADGLPARLEDHGIPVRQLHADSELPVD